MVLKPVTIKLDDKEIRYLDRQIGKGRITSRSSAVRTIVRESMERTDLCRGSAWTEVNRSSRIQEDGWKSEGKSVSPGGGPQGQTKARTKPNITFEDVLVDGRIATGELKVADDGRVLQADDETVEAIVRKRWFDPRKVVWTEYKPIHPEECPPGPYIHWSRRDQEVEGSVHAEEAESPPRKVAHRNLSESTFAFIRGRRRPHLEPFRNGHDADDGSPVTFASGRSAM